MSIDEALAQPATRASTTTARTATSTRKSRFDFGNVEEGFAEADHIREDTFFFEGNTHLPMEQHSALAAYGPDGKLTLWSATQTPHYVHRAVAKVLEMAPAHVRVIACPNGGGFGGKSDPFSHELVVCKLSMKTGRPVKITLNREEVFYCHRGRHPVRMWVKTGLKKDGRITAMHFRSALDGGGYGSYGVASLYYTGALQTVTYKVPRYRFDGVRVFTNKPPCGPKRGHGTPQPRFALEAHIDKFCRDLGLDPADWRLRNTVAPGTITANQMQVKTIGLKACLERVIERSGYRDKHGGRWATGRGIGIAGSAYISGAGLPIYWNAMPHSGVQVKVDRGGGVAVFCGSTDIGQGIGLDPRLHRGRGARHPARGHPRRHRRHRPHAGGPRVVFVAGHPDDRQRGDPGRAQGAAADPRRRRAQARRARRPAARAQPAHLRRRESRTRA